MTSSNLTSILLCISLTITSICLVTCTKAPETKTDKTTEAASESKAMVDNSKAMMESKASMDFKSAMDDADSKDYDLMAVMTICNESFRIEMSYLISLNESGSFPDETDKTPKCYLRCVLENLNVANPEDGKLDPERAAAVFAGARNGEPMDDIQEMATSCAEHRDEVCHCEMAYNFLKCLFSMEIEKYMKPKS